MCFCDVVDFDGSSSLDFKATPLWSTRPLSWRIHNADEVGLVWHALFLRLVDQPTKSFCHCSCCWVRISSSERTQGWGSVTGALENFGLGSST